MLKNNQSQSQDKHIIHNYNSIKFGRSPELFPLKRENILAKFTQKELDSCWESLSVNIIQNYQRGKATCIKGFGTFTYKGTEVNLEGVTNEIIKDKKERLPVFIVSKEFNEHLKPGEYTKEYGIRYFTTKENKNIPICNLNYSEIAFSLSMPKDTVFEIIKNLIKHISESISKKKFKSKLMPGLGVLLLKQNILAVKFEENFENNIKDKNRKLNILKNNISLDLCFDDSKESFAGGCPNLYNTAESIKATNSLTTECKQSVKNYLRKSYNIHIKNNNNSGRNLYIKNGSNVYNTVLGEDKKGKIFFNNKFFLQKNNPFVFLNDYNTKTVSSSRNKILKTDNAPLGGMGPNPLLNLDNNILKTLTYFKGSMIKDSKDLDVHKTGSISKEEAITMLMKNIPELNHNLSQEIIEHYFISDQIDYMKLIALLIRGSKNCFIKKKNYFNFKKFFVNLKNKNDSLNQSNGFHNNIQKNINLKSIIQKQKDKKIAIIHEAEKEAEEKEKENIINRYKKDFEEKEDRLKNIERNKGEIVFLISLIPIIKNKYATFLDQNINTEELIRILEQYDLVYTKEKLDDILKFIDINDCDKFSLREFINNIQLCKITNASMGIAEFSNILNIIKDIIYVHGGEKFLFNNELNNKNTIDIKTFINLLKDKTNISVDKLQNVFYYIVKTDRSMTINDYKNYFVQKSNNSNKYDDHYFINMMKQIILNMTEKKMSVFEYFYHLLSYNISTQDKVITRLNWIKYLQLEKYKFHAEELDHFFNWIDIKKDDIIDIEEFTNRYQYTTNPLTKLQSIIHRNKLDIEDLAHRMQMDKDEIKKMDYLTFSKHLQRLDYTLSDSFIRKIFNQLKEKDDKTDKEFIDSRKFLTEINYIKPKEKEKENENENEGSFIQKYINTVKSKTTYEYLKKHFEKYDRDSLGTMSKLDYVKSMSYIFPEFNDDDHMKFIRIKELLNKNNKVIYPEVLNVIFYFNVNKMNDQFTKISEFLIEKLKNECDNDVEKLMYLIETGSPKKASSLNKHKPLTINQLNDFLIKSNLPIEKKVIMKFDVDSDGQLSYDDLYSVLLRYRDTLYFKFYNNSSIPNINLFSKDMLSKDKIHAICEKLWSYMKMKNITPLGLFKKFDKDNNGLISNIDFNQGIKELLNINAALSDPFFAYFDYYNVGMIDYETFRLTLNYWEKNKFSENNRKEENEIIDRIKAFILKNNHLCENEIFQIMDKDCDGLINYNDLSNFIKYNLAMTEKAYNKSKIERVMMALSLTKNLQIGFNDICEFIKSLSKENKLNINLKEIFEINANQNLSQKKKNVDWINDVIVRFGMYVSEKYDSIEQFYNESIEPGSNKFKFSDFLKFHESHYDLFNHGFHLTKDELLSIFTSLDSQKKDFLTLQDLQNKLQYFNFYKKMHFELKDFFQTNFKNGVDAFKYFFIGKNTNEERRYFITIKEFFDGFENFFPKKYENSTIYKYLNKYFKITLPTDNKNDQNKKNTIDFSEFNYIYFDKSEENEVFLNNFNEETKLMNRINLMSDNNDNNDGKKYHLSQLFKIKNKTESLMTPFDIDPFYKLMRIINSSKYDINSFFDEAIKQNRNNPYMNKSQLRNFIKKLNIGLTHLEIEIILKKCSKEMSTDNGETINLKRLKNVLIDDYSYSDLSKGINNIKNKISEIKSLIYKFYSSPIICFQINDIDQTGKIDFQKYRNLIVDLYKRNEQEIPNFTLIKNTFDTIDLRKDGIIDYNEWSKSFSMVGGKLDLAYEKKEIKNIRNLRFNKTLRGIRQWENSDDITQKYILIYKNRKQIKNKLIENNFIINKNGKQYVNSDSLILLIKNMFPNVKLGHIQWKLITNIGKGTNVDNLVEVSNFFKLIEISAKKSNNFKPYKTSLEFNKIYYGSFDTSTLKPHRSSLNSFRSTGNFSESKNINF